MSNEGCKDAWTLLYLWDMLGCTEHITTEISDISDNHEGSQETRSHFMFL